MEPRRVHGEVLELADRHDLGSCAARHEGSSPSFPTNAFAEFEWRQNLLRQGGDENIAEKNIIIKKENKR